MKLKQLATIAYGVFALFNTPIHAQNVKVEEGQIYSGKSKSFYDRVLVGSKDVLLNNSPNRIFVEMSKFECYDENLNLKSAFELDLSSKKISKGSLEYTGIVGDNLVAFYADNSKSVQKLYGKVYGMDGIEQSETKEIDQFTVKDEKFYFDKLDSKTINVYHWTGRDKDSKDPRVLTYKTYDKNLEFVKEVKLELPYQGEDFTIHSWLNDDKAFYFLTSMKQTNGETKRRKKKDSPSGFSVLRFDIATSKFTEQDLSLGNAKVVSNLNFKLSGGKLYVYGMYKNTLDGDYLGFLQSRVDATSMDVESESTVAFDDNVLKCVLTPREYKKQKSFKPTYYNISGAFVKKNGDLTLAMESNMSITTTSQNGSYTTYYSGDVVIMNITPDGKSNWSHVIQKNQVARSFSEYLSHYSLMVNDQLHFVFFDNIKNTKIFDSYMEPERFNFLKNQAIFDEVISPSGEAKRELVMPFKNNDKFKDIIYCHLFKTNDNTLLFVKHKKKKTKLVTMKFN